MAHTGVTAVPRVLTSAELVNSFIPFFTVPAAYQLVNVMLLFTDQHFKLFALVATLCFLLYLSEWGLEWLFKLNDGKVDRLERVYLYCILLVRRTVCVLCVCVCSAHMRRRCASSSSSCWRPFSLPG